jgi:UDP-glucose 4-epimerase
MKAIVTGGAGFIGSHLVDQLLKEGNAVTVIDNLSTGSMENLAHQSRNPNLIIRRADILHLRALERILRGHDAVFHLAASANMRRSLTDHRLDLEDNVIGTLNVLEAMINDGVKDFVFASSSALYGEAPVRPTPEDFLGQQTSLYGASKLACEAYAQAYTEFTPLKVWSFRFATVIGERCRKGVIWDFVKKLKHNPQELEILGDGKQSKQYLYVKDCVNGILSGYRHFSGRVNTINLGVNEQTLVDRVADLVIEEMSLKNVSRRYTGGARGWVGDNAVVDLSLDRMKLASWKNALSAEEAIRTTIKWTIQEQSPRSGRLHTRSHRSS